MSIHSQLILGDIHALNARTYADLAAMIADTAFNTDSDNFNKVVRVESPFGIFWLIASGTFQSLSTVDISCKVTMSALQVIANDTDVLITWNQEDYDTNDMHSNTVNNSRITIQTAGKYFVTSQAIWEDNSVGAREISILKNSVVSGVVRYLADGNSQHIVSFVDEFAVDDFVELSVKQISGGVLQFSQSATYFEAHKIN